MDSHYLMDVITTFYDNYNWLIPAVLVCLLASIASGICGAYVVSRKINNAAGGIAHIVLGGAGVSVFFDVPIIFGAIGVAIIGAMVIGFISQKMPEHEDLAINSLWSASMAIGIILLAKSPMVNFDYAASLFGSVLLSGSEDVWLLAGTDIILVVMLIFFRRAFLSISFDSEFAKSRGLPVKWLHHLQLLMIALSVVALVRVVGIVFVVALITVPVAIAKLTSHTLKGWMWLSIGINIFLSLLGIVLAFWGDLPVGATIVLLLGGIYLALMPFVSGRH